MIFLIDGSGVTGNITNVSGSGSNYIVTVSSVSGTGTLSIDLKSSGTNIIDANSNAISGGFIAGAIHTVDTDVPSATNITVNGSPTANATSLSYNVIFNENVTGVSTNDFTIDASGVTANITNVSGSGSNYVVTVSSVFGTGTLSIDLKASGTGIVDASNNAINTGFITGATHTVDTIAPNLTTSIPVDNATGILINQNIELTFNENISKGTGNLIIKKTSDNSILETINISSAQVSITSNKATVNLSNNFELNTGYYIEIDNTVFNDAANNSYAGISLNSTLNFISEANQTNIFSPFNGNWSDAINWSLGRLPIVTDNIVIETGKTVNLNITDASVNNMNINISGTLNILSGNALTVNGNLTQNGIFNILSSATSNGSLIVRGTSTGNVTYFRYVTTNWHLVATPVVGQTINTLVGQVNTNGNKYAIAPYVNNTTTLLRYNYYTDNTGGNDIATAGNFTTAKGYILQKSTVAGTIAFTGSLNIDNLGESIVITDGGDNPAGNRWNLVGNPYTSAIKGNNAADAINNFLKINIDAGNLDPTRAGLYLWNGTAYEIKSLDDAALNIAPGQAFFVHAPDTGGTSVSFTETMQTHQTGNLFLKNEKSYPEIILNLSNGKIKTYTKLRYIKNKTKGLDVGSDVGTFTGENTNFSIYSHLLEDNKNIDFAIQALPDNNYETMVVPIGVNSTSAKELTFSLNSSNFPSGLKIFLEDKKLNKSVRLDNLNKYSITLDEVEKGIGRFFLHTRSNALNLNNNLSKENITIYKLNNNKLRIINLPQGNKVLSVFNIMGKKILKTSFTSIITKDIILSNLPKGVYLVQLKTEIGQINKKIIIK